MTKSKTQKVQVTTSDCTNINAVQKHRWHRNTGVLCDKLEQDNNDFARTLEKESLW